MRYNIIKKFNLQQSFCLNKSLDANEVSQSVFSKQNSVRWLFVKLFVLSCVGCSGYFGGGLNHLSPYNGFGGNNQSELLPFRHRGLYTTSSLVLSLSQSPFLQKGLSDRESKILFLSGLVLSDLIKESIVHFLDIKFEQVNGYRIEYTRVDPYSKRHKIKVSGLVLIPSGSYSFPLLAYFHPTLLQKNQAPSLIPPSFLSLDPFKDDRAMMVLLALQGYIVFAPDYIGYGSSEDRIHPYLYKPSVVQTTKSMLKALVSVLHKQNVPFKRDLFITGYSQGGHGAVAFAEAMQNDPMDFNVKAVFAGGGPYDLLYTARKHLDQLILSEDILVLSSYLLQSYSYIYEWDLNEIVRKPSYVEMISSMFKYDNLFSVVQGLPKRTDSLFRSQFIRDIKAQNNNYNLFQSPLVENSVYDWTPEIPILLYHGREDNIVPYNNMKIAHRFLNSYGGNMVKTKNCDLKKLEDLMDIVNDINNRQVFTKTTNHVNCLFAFFFEINDYFSNYW